MNVLYYIDAASSCVPVSLADKHCNLSAAFGWDGESAALGSCAIGPPGDDCRRQVLLYAFCTESFAQSLTCFLPPSVTFWEVNLHLFLFDLSSSLPCIAKKQGTQQRAPHKTAHAWQSPCLHSAVHIAHTETTLTYPNLSAACMFWPALKARPSKHSTQTAGGTVLKRKTTKDHKGHQLRVRLHNIQPACITCQGRLCTCSADALIRHCFPHLVQIGNPCYAMAWK